MTARHDRPLAWGLCAILLAAAVCSAAAQDTQTPAGLYIKARFLVDDGRCSDAVPLFDRAIALDPTFARAFTSRGYCKLRTTPPDTAGALADFSRAIELAPDLIDAWVLRGEIRFRQASYAGALEDFERAAALDTSYPRVFYNRGLARLQIGDLAGALSDLDRHVSANPDDVWAYLGRAGIRRAQGDAAAEIADLEHAVRVDPACARAYQERGDWMVKQRRLQEARADFNRAVALEPANPVHQRRLIDVEQRLAAPPQAAPQAPAPVPPAAAPPSRQTPTPPPAAPPAPAPTPDAGATARKGPVTEADRAALAQALLSTFSRRVVFLDRKDDDDEAVYRVIFEDLSGEYLEMELRWVEAEADFDVADVTAVSHGTDAGALDAVLQGYRRK